ncbi:lymphocyte antigen 6E-like [Lissotriton helveticus]
MKVLLVSLLAAALCAGIVHSLQCYTCTGASKNSDCQTVSNCTSTDTSCQTAVIKYLVAISITKSCSSSCTASDVSVLGVGYTTTCCKDSLCNISGATSMKMSYLLLSACLGFLGLLLRDKL